MHRAKRLVLAHPWVAFALFAFAAVLGAWQMLVRSSLGAPLETPSVYYASVTLHGTAMAYVLTSFFAMGFGYFVAVTALDRDLPSLGGLLDRGRRDRHGRGADPARQGLRPLHLLPAAHRQRLLLPRRAAGRERLLDLGGADGGRHGRVEAGAPGPAGPARHVRHRGELDPVAVDRRRG